jgi:hypothetical protein
MAKTNFLGLNLTEEENTSFSDWRRSIDGNGSGESKSNMQLIDEAIRECKNDIFKCKKAIYVSYPLSLADQKTVLDNFRDGQFRIYLNFGAYTFPLCIEKYVSTNETKLCCVVNFGDVALPNNYTSEKGLYECGISINSKTDEAYCYATKLDDNSVYLVETCTFADCIKFLDSFGDKRIWYNPYGTNGDGIPNGPNVLLTNMGLYLHEGNAGYLASGLVVEGNSVKMIGIFLNPSTETLSHISKDLFSGS